MRVELGTFEKRDKAYSYVDKGKSKVQGFATQLASSNLLGRKTLHCNYSYNL